MGPPPIFDNERASSGRALRARNRSAPRRPRPAHWLRPPPGPDLPFARGEPLL